MPKVLKHTIWQKDGLLLWLAGFCMLLMTTSGCGIYSFTGASVSPGIKTVTINNFPNESSLVIPVLRQNFVDELKDKFVSNTNLSLVDLEGDLEFSGSIVDTRVQPSVSGGNDQAQKNRLTIRIRVEYYNKVDEESWTEEFSHFEDFDSTAKLSDVEEELTNQIVDVLVQKVFNKALVDW